MEITFRTRKLAAVFNSSRALQREYGDRMARTVASRMAVLEASDTLGEAGERPPLGLHQLRGDRSGTFAVILVQPYRLVLRPNHDPVPLKADGEIDLAQVTAITVVDVVDYH